MARAKGLCLVIGHDCKGGGEAIGQGCSWGEGVAAAIGHGDRLKGSRVHDVLTLLGLTGSAKSLFDEGDFTVTVFGIEADGPCGSVARGAKSQDGAVTSIQEGVVDSPVGKDRDGLIKCVALADRAKVEAQGRSMHRNRQIFLV